MCRVPCIVAEGEEGVDQIVGWKAYATAVHLLNDVIEFAASRSVARVAA